MSLEGENWVSLSRLRASGLAPSHKTACRQWCERHAVQLERKPVRGGKAIFCRVDTLPSSVRRQLRAGQTEPHDSNSGGDDFGHARAAYAAATAKAKQRADWQAQLASLIELGMGRPGATLTAVVDELAAQHSESASTLKRIWRKVEHVPQPARAWVLTPGWRAGEGDWNAAELAFFDHVKAQMNRSVGVYPLTEAYRDAVRISGVPAAAQPSYARVLRRWNELPATERTLIAHGAGAVRRHRHPTFRNKPAASMDVVCIDARAGDIAAVFPDGTVQRPVILAAEDVHSSRILATVIAKSESAAAVRELVLKVFAEFGLPGMIHLDNSSANATLGVGSVKDKMDDTQRSIELERRLLHRLRVGVYFAAPFNGREKTVERRYGDLSPWEAGPHFNTFRAYLGRNVDTRPDGAKGAVPFNVLTAEYDRWVGEYNARDGRRGEGQCGRSFNQTFADGLKLRARPPARLTEEQWAMARRSPFDVTPHKETGVITLRHYGRFGTRDEATVNAILRARDAAPDNRVVLWIDPDNLDAGGIVTDTANQRTIIDHLPRIAAQDFYSVDHAQRVKRADARARKKQSAADEAREEAIAVRFSPPDASSIPDSPGAAPAGVAAAPAFGVAKLKAAAATVDPAPDDADGVDLLAAYDFDAASAAPERKRASGGNR